MPPEFHTHVLELPADAAGQRLDQALAAALPQYSRARIQRWIRDGHVKLGGVARSPRPRDRVAGGEQVTLAAEFEAVVGLEPEARTLAIVHEDAALIVLDKPPGLVVHPGAGNPRHTLQQALLAYDARLARVPRAGLVHRLDKDTSGLMVVARTPEAHTRLVESLQVRAIRRGDMFLLCSDGLSGPVAADEMRDALSRMGPQEAARHLIGLACERGGEDNITTVICRVEEVP